MAILLDCAACGRQFRVKDHFRGTPIKCPGCKTKMLVEGPHVQGYDVFISYSSKDSQVADAVCAALESKGVRCWIAPRDIPAGASWGAAIIEGIEDSRVMLLVFSEHSNGSDQVLREVERAVAKRIPLVPLRLDKTPMSKALEYFLAACHWQDATDGPLEDHLAGLTSVIRARLLHRAAEQSPADAAAAAPPTSAPPPVPDGQVRSMAIKVSAVVLGVAAIAGAVALSLRDRSEHATTSRTDSAVIATVPGAATWTPLFNGKNLDGWSLHGSKVTQLTVADGVLTATNTGRPGFHDDLVTDRHDFQNFRLRYEFNVTSEAPYASVKLRVDPSDVTFGGMRCYGVHFTGAGPVGAVRYNVSSRIRQNLRLAESDAPSFKPDKWVAVVVTVNGYRATIEVDGKPTIEITDVGSTFPRGAIALGFVEKTVTQYRNIEIQELPPSPPSERRFRWVYRKLTPNNYNERWGVFAYADPLRWIETFTHTEGFVRYEWKELRRTDEFVEIERPFGNGKLFARLYDDHGDFGPSLGKLKPGIDGNWEPDSAAPATSSSH